jgi:hypothetical protein
MGKNFFVISNRVRNLINMKRVSCITILLFLVSCNNDKYYNQEIIGHWSQTERLYRVGEEIRFTGPIDPYWMRHLTFDSNGSFINKFGFKLLKSDSQEDKICHFLGNESKFEIADRKLKIFNLEEKKYLVYEIAGITYDTLKLIGDEKKDTLYFKREKYEIKCKDTFDKILISSSGCFGSCPISNTLIDKNGQVIFEGIDYNTVNGLYKSKINQSEFEEILKSFQKANWKNLKDNYVAGHTDDESITVTFIKDDKLVKQIKDYGHEAPDEFNWAYLPLRFLYQRLKLTPIIQSKEKLDENTLLLFKLKKEIYARDLE